MKQGRVSTGHPVDVASGIVFTAWHDIDVPGLVPLCFRRYYSTALIASPARIFRRGWVYSLEMMLARGASGYTLWGPDGSLATFDDPAGIVDAGGTARSFGDSMELRRDDDHYVVYHWHDWREEVQKFVFPIDGRSVMYIQALEIPSGHALAFTYDGNGLLRQVKQAIEGRALELTYDPLGRLGELWLSSPVASPLLVATYEYDAQDRLVSVVDVLGVPIRYAYDSEHRLVLEQGRTGGTYRMEYDATGRGIRISGDAGYQLRVMQYDDANTTTHVTDSLGSITSYRWNAVGQIVEQILPNAGVERTEFDQFGRLVARFGPSGEVMRRTYNRLGDIESISYPGGGFTAFEYNAEHQPLSIHQSNGSVLRFAYARGAMVSLADAAGATTFFQRDARNLVIRIRTAAGATVEVFRDTAWSSERYTDDVGFLRAYRFDARLNITEVADARGLLRRFAFDQRGYFVSDETPDGQSRRYTRNALGLPENYVSRGGATTRYDYDSHGHRIRLVDPFQRVCEYRWDSEGRLSEMTNQKGELAAFESDALGNLTMIQFFDGRIERFRYDASSRRNFRRKPDGTILAFTYDEAGNFLSVAEGGQPLSANEYDLLGQLTATRLPHSEVTFEYDLGGRLIAETQNGQRAETAYTDFGMPAQRSFSGATQRLLQFDYDTRRRLVRAKDQQGAFVNYEYDAANLLLRRRFAALTEEFEYDSRRRMRTQTVLDAAGTRLIARTFAYDADDRVIRISDSRRGDFSFAYDAGGRLVGTTDPSGVVQTFAYDECGNLTRKGGANLSYGPGDRLVSHGAMRYERDANGNPTAAVATQRTEFHWNSFDQLVAVVQPNGTCTRYRYDGLGRRISVERDGEQTDFYWWSNDLLCERHKTIVIDYFIAAFVPQALWIDGDVRHIVNSFSLQPSELIDKSAAVVWSGDHDVWGSPRGPMALNSPVRLGFPGQYYDEETGLHNNRFRYYSATDGRYLTPDPLGLVPGLNEYSYGVDPLNWVDPMGLACGLTHFVVVENPNLPGRDGQPPPTRADWIAKRDAFNATVQANMAAGTPLTVPTTAQYAADRAVGNREAAAARVAQGMGPGVQADHPVELIAGGGQGQALYPLQSGVNGSSGSQIRPQAAALAPGSPTPMMDLVDQQGNLI